jgi:Zn-dependent M28 family amino/carboxypeptidase
MNRTLRILALLPVLAAIPPAFALAAGFALPADAQSAAARITPATLRAPIAFLADDLLEGRGPATPGDRLARLYIASQLEALGLQPGGSDGSWEQAFDVVGLDAKAPAVWKFSKAGREVGLAWSQDYIGASGVQETRAEVKDAEVVFVGYGIQAPEYQWDDFKGVSLKGKVLLMLNNDPDWDEALFAGKRRLYYGRWTYKYESAARQGAAAAIIVHTEPSAGYPWQVVQTSWSGEQFELPAQSEPRIQFRAWATEEASRRLVELAGKNLDQLIAAAHRNDFKPVPLGVTTGIVLETKIEKAQTANVLGLLPGSDPALGKEVVIYSAHHDHLGIGEPNAKGDKIYNGAVDNASGVSLVLSVARAFVALPERPKRSVLFALVAAEEQGLLGSAYLSRHPTFPAGRIAANINLDSANKFGRTRDLTYIGYGKSKDLDAVVDGAAALQHRTVQGDQNPDKGYFYRSDQFNFAKIGVPAIYLDPGTDYLDHDAAWGKAREAEYTSRDYHQPSDELDSSWSFDGMVEDAQLAFYCGVAIADAPTMPVWNAGDEFEEARKKAIEAAASSSK